MSSVQDEKIAEIDRKLAELDRPPVPDVQRHGVEISNDEYHQLPGVSASKLKDFIEDPRLYHYKHLSGEYVQESKPHFDFGQAVHDIVLLGDSSKVKAIPDGVLSGGGAKRGKAWDAFKEANTGQTLLKPAEYDELMGCVNALRTNPVAKELLSQPGVSERMYEHFDGDLGLRARCRPDRLCLLPDRNIVMDIKTSSKSTLATQFGYAVRDFGYDIQEAFYRYVLAANDIRVDAFVFVVVGTTAPHTVDCYQLSEDRRTARDAKVQEAMLELSRRTADNDWRSETESRIVTI